MFFYAKCFHYCVGSLLLRGLTIHVNKLTKEIVSTASVPCYPLRTNTRMVLRLPREDHRLHSCLLRRGSLARLGPPLDQSCSSAPARSLNQWAAQPLLDSARNRWTSSSTLTMGTWTPTGEGGFEALGLCPWAGASMVEARGAIGTCTRRRDGRLGRGRCCAAAKASHSWTTSKSVRSAPSFESSPSR